MLIPVFEDSSHLRHPSTGTSLKFQNITPHLLYWIRFMTWILILGVRIPILAKMETMRNKNPHDWACVRLLLLAVSHNPQATN
jgi:hypothetical protein